MYQKKEIRADGETCHKVCPAHKYKIKYATRKAALNAANTSNKIHDIQLRVYKCNICRHYHLTSRKEG